MVYVVLKPQSIARVHCIIDEIEDGYTQRMWERLLDINDETGFETDTVSTLNAIINSSDSDGLHQFLDDMRAPSSPVEQRDPMQTVKPLAKPTPVQTVKPLAKPTTVQTDTIQDPMGDVKKAPDLKWVGAWCAIAWQYMQALDFSWVNGCALAAWTKNVTSVWSPERPRLLYFSTRWVAKLEKRVSTVEDQLRRGFHTKRSLVELSRGARVHARVLKPVNIKAGPAMENLQTLVNLHGKDISVLSDMLHASTVSVSTQLQVYDADKAQMQAEISDLKASLKRSEDRLDSLLAALRNVTERVDKQESAMAVMANTMEEQELALGRVEQLAKHTAFVVGIHTAIHMYEALSAAGFFQTVGSWFGPIGKFLTELGGPATL